MIGKRKKILFYSGHCETVGGDAKYLFELVSGLDYEKYEVVVCADENYLFRERAKQWLTREIHIQYLETHPILFKRGILQSLIDGSLNISSAKGWKNSLVRVVQKSSGCALAVRCLRKLCRMLSFSETRAAIHNIIVFNKLFKQHAPVDIFHFNNGGYLGKVAGLWGIIVARYRGIQNIVMTIQNLPATKTIRLSDHFFDLVIKKCCTKFVPVSFKLKDKLVQNRDLPANNITPIYHGLEDVLPLTEDAINHKKRELGISESVRLLMIVSNIDEERKGHRVLFEALVLIRRKIQNVMLLVVGDGTMLQVFEGVVRELDLLQNVCFLGHRQDVSELNDIIDIAVVPSIAFEGIPYTIREAMRSGKPVITTDAGGCDEAVLNEISGFVVEQRNAQQLASAIVRLLEDSELCKRMGMESRKLFEKNFLLEEKICEHEKIYDSFEHGASL